MTYSVQSYLDQVITNNGVAGKSAEENEKLVALCMAMSDYGSYAQVQQNYVPGQDANALTPKDLFNENEIAQISTSVLKDTAYSKTNSTNIKFQGASLIMEGEMVLRFYFKYTGTGTLSSGGKDLPMKQGYYYVDVTNIAAKDFALGQNVAVTDGTETASVSNYSVHTYIRKVLTNYPNPTEIADVNLVNLSKAIAEYGFKAAAYFAIANP